MAAERVRLSQDVTRIKLLILFPDCHRQQQESYHCHNGQSSCEIVVHNVVTCINRVLARGTDGPYM